MEKLKELLIRSFDDESFSTEEQKLLDEALSKYPELQQEKLEIEEMRITLSGYEPSFDTGFSKQVLNQIGSEVSPNDNLFYLFKRFALGGVAAIIALLISAYLTDGNFSLDSLLGITNLTPDNLLLAFSTL